MDEKKLSRRQFLRLAVTAAAGSAVAACAPAAPPAAAPPTAAPAAAATAVPAKPAEQKPATQPPAAATKKVSFTTWGSIGEVQLNKDIAEAFKKDNPGTDVEIIHVPDQYFPKLLISIASGTAPDVWYLGADNFPELLAKDTILDLTPYFQLNPELTDPKVYTTMALDAFSMAGKRYATVNGTNTIVIYYNKDMFDKAKVPYPGEDLTWDTLVELAQKLVVRKGETLDQYGLLSSTGWWEYWPPMIWSNGGKWFDQQEKPTKCLVNSEPGVKTFRYLQDLIHKFKVAPTPAEAQALSQATRGGLFPTGKVAMQMTGSWSVADWSKIDAFKWDMQHLPKGSASRKSSWAVGGYVINKVTKDKDLAWAYAKYYMSETAQKMIGADGLITPEMRKVAESDAFLKKPGFPEHHRVRYDAVEYSPHRSPITSKWAEITGKAWQPELDKLLLNQQTPEETAKKMADAADAVLAAP